MHIWLELARIDKRMQPEKALDMRTGGSARSAHTGQHILLETLGRASKIDRVA